MAERRIRLKIVDAKVPCGRGHKIGDEWDLSNGQPAGLCHWAWNSIYPFYCILRYGGRLPWQGDDDWADVSCPDPDVCQRYRLEIVDG